MKELCLKQVFQAIINFAKKREAAKLSKEPVPDIGLGIAMAIGLFLLTVSASIGQHQVLTICLQHKGSHIFF